MLFLGVPAGYYDYLMVSIFGGIIFVCLLLIGLWYMYKSRVLEKGSAIPILCILLVILVPIFILFMPSLFGGWSGGYTTAATVLTWGIGIVAVVFIIFLYLIRSKKKIMEDSGTLRPKAVRQEGVNLSGMKLGIAIIIIGGILAILFNLFGINWYFFANDLILISVVVIASAIIVGAIYSQYCKKFSIYGSSICIFAGISTIGSVFYFKYLMSALWGEPISFFFMDYIPIILGALSIIGVILHHVELKGGSILCAVSGCISLIMNFLFAGFYGGLGFLTIYIFISLEPILMIIGGYLLYQESSRV